MREAHDDLLVLEEGNCPGVVQTCCTASQASVR